MKQIDYQVLNMLEKEAQHKHESGERSPFQLGIPLVDISDATIEEIYYFRWHIYSKHIKKTPSGYVVTEFLPPVPWAGKYNTISCPAGHHMYEGRWLHSRGILTDYAKFWFTPDATPRRYSFWAADAILAICSVTGDFSLAESLYEPLKDNFASWEAEKLMPNGLFYQIDDRDGMEYSAGGSGCRPTINSYMFGDAVALSKIALRLNKPDEAKIYAAKANSIKEKVDSLLWDDEASFYKTLAEKNDYSKADVRELIGYIPWYFHLASDGKEAAWQYLNDERYFYAPYEPNVLAYAESEDGIHWAKSPINPIFTAKATNVYEQNRVGGCQVIKTDDMGYVMFYIGYENIHKAQICAAKSPNGITQWERSELNPVVCPTPDSWDSDACYKPSFLWNEQTKQWMLWYNGRSSSPEYIGLALKDGRELF